MRAQKKHRYTKSQSEQKSLTSVNDTKRHRNVDNKKVENDSKKGMREHWKEANEQAWNELKWRGAKWNDMEWVDGMWEWAKYHFEMVTFNAKWLS